MLEPIPLGLKKMTRLPVKPHEKKRDGKESEKRLDPIPCDVEVEILTRLPVKSVMRSRCVSKMWSSIIRSQGFIDSYYAMSSATRSRFTVAFSNSIFVNGDAKRLFIFSSSHQEESSSSSSSLVANLDMTIPSLSLAHGSQCRSVHGFVGSCYDFQFTICNPSTRQLVTLTCKGSRTSLGYDPVDDQFKTLTLVPTSDHGYDCFTVHEVIRLGGGGESRCKVTSPPFCPLTKGLCINGFVYYAAWAPRPRTNPVIVCFDVRCEKLSFIRTPDDVVIRESDSVLIEYKGKLASIVRHEPLSFRFRSFDLWILEDVKKHAWSKQTFELPYYLVNMTSPGTNKAGEIMFAPKKLLHDVQTFFYIFYYNLVRKDMRRVRIHGIADDEAFRRRYGLVGDCNVSVSPEHVESIASL